jgi:hypothetical protein
MYSPTFAKSVLLAEVKLATSSDKLNSFNYPGKLAKK